MYKYICLVSFILLGLDFGCYGADILAIIPTASFSHQVPYRPLWRELARRGHNITLVTTDPMKDPNLKHVKEIDISYAYEYMESYQVIEIASNDSNSFYEMAVAIRKATNASNNAFFQSPEGQNLIHNKDNHFDLLIVEAQLPAMMIFSWRYQIPFIGVCSLDCSLQYHETAGNMVHPLVTPDPNLPIEDIKNLTFWERLQSFIYINVFRGLIYLLTFPREQKMLQYYFGESVPTLVEIQSNLSMMFVATNPVFHPLRALMPNTITIGNGLHLGETLPLSEDVEKFLIDAKQGAIYFSLGSNIKGKNLNDTTKRELLKAFASLPYKVLWKIDHKFDNLPPNIIVSKWFKSQPDILRHPNIKVFITQGGLQSMQESIHANKPMIGIPFFGDQHMNVKRMVQLGYGLKVHKHNITQGSIREAVIEIMTNPKKMFIYAGKEQPSPMGKGKPIQEQRTRYTEKAKEYGDIFRDVDISNVDKAVWWTEYVIRHKGARHFKNPLLDAPFWKTYMLDVFGVLFLVLFMIINIIRGFLRILNYILRRRKTTDIAKKTN